jgi:hypothetical protein
MSGPPGGTWRSDKQPLLCGDRVCRGMSRSAKNLQLVLHPFAPALVGAGNWPQCRAHRVVASRVALLLLALALAAPVLAAFGASVDGETAVDIDFSAALSGADSAHGETGASGAARKTGRVLRVGAKHRFKKPSEAATEARDGDVVEIDAGPYTNDHAVWRQNDLTLRGVGGMAHIRSQGEIPNGKAIWIVAGDNVLIENMEFSGAAVRDTNGAGIRHQGGRLTLNNTFFHDNEFSILNGELPGADIEIRNSRFWNQRRPVRHSHGIYIGKVRSLKLIGNHFKGTDKGHQVKSRALANLIAYNRIEDVDGGTSSRLVDLSNCGFSIVIGNQLQQAPSSQNFNAIGYGPEGCERRSGLQKRLYVVYNTFVNEAPGGDFVRNFANATVLEGNNLVYGAGTTLAGPGTETGNVRMALDRVPPDRWSAPPAAAVVDAATPLLDVEAAALVPLLEFSPPLGTRVRAGNGRLDVGAAGYRPGAR